MIKFNVWLARHEGAVKDDKGDVAATFSVKAKKEPWPNWKV